MAKRAVRFVEDGESPQHERENPLDIQLLGEEDDDGADPAHGIQLLGGGGDGGDAESDEDDGEKHEPGEVLFEAACGTLVGVLWSYLVVLQFNRDGACPGTAQWGGGACRVSQCWVMVLGLALYVAVATVRTALRAAAARHHARARPRPRRLRAATVANVQRLLTSSFAMAWSVGASAVSTSTSSVGLGDRLPPAADLVRAPPPPPGGRGARATPPTAGARAVAAPRTRTRRARHARAVGHAHRRPRASPSAAARDRRGARARGLARAADARPPRGGGGALWVEVWLLVRSSGFYTVGYAWFELFGLLAFWPLVAARRQQRRRRRRRRHRDRRRGAQLVLALTSRARRSASSSARSAGACARAARVRGRRGRRRRARDLLHRWRVRGRRRADVVDFTSYRRLARAPRARRTAFGSRSSTSSPRARSAFFVRRRLGREAAGGGARRRRAFKRSRSCGSRASRSGSRGGDRQGGLRRDEAVGQRPRPRGRRVWRRALACGSSCVRRYAVVAVVATLSRIHAAARAGRLRVRRLALEASGDR